MADTLEANYMLDENDAASVIGSDDGAVSIPDEPEPSNEASEDQQQVASRPNAQETKDEAARKEDKKRKRKEKEKARKQKVSSKHACLLLNSADMVHERLIDRCTSLTKYCVLLPFVSPLI